MTAMYRLVPDSSNLFSLVVHFDHRAPKTNQVKNFGIDLGLFIEEGRHIEEGRYAYLFQGTFKEVLTMITFTEALF